MAESGEQQFGTPAAYSPIAVEGLKPGDVKYWCRCGLSKKQPWCDGSHKGTGMTPLKWTVEEEKTYYLCACKQTKNPPLCDGNHKTAKEDILARKERCTKDKTDCKLCTGCGWSPDF